ncbi:uncharacterized protein LOC122256116 [Penaeus japonicus]|uniref:uncharacterized protein LOC122256116 n=1 Tax=Penaeus japonicus TaxID=27405 RepID=UPI001C715931|nr:uncharacterized protein LOC122256116 [Penaeus japonicus]
MDTRFLKQLAHLVEGEVSSDKRMPRDGGYGGGGCGGFEVFAFLAFLLALLNLVLQLNDDNNRRRRSVYEEEAAAVCRGSLDLSEGVWAVSQLTEGVMKAIASPPTCSHALLCDAASSAASRGPLAATFTALASDWLERWPGLQESGFGHVTRRAGLERDCSHYARNNCTTLQLPDFDLQHMVNDPATLPMWRNVSEDLKRHLVSSSSS